MATDYMARALALAREALGQTSPNPAVGAVVVRDGEIIGEGRTQPPGSWHAEVVALRQAGDRARGATLYVTLEPCCHFGRTPPCTQTVIQSGIAEVRMAMLDPNPLVRGNGQAELEVAGIRTHAGERETEAREAVEGFVRWIGTQRPLVTAKFAASLDGKIATRTGESKWITGEVARGRVHELRRQVDAIVVGIGTVLADDPQLTARPNGRLAERQPLRVVVDSRLRLPLRARLLQAPGRTLVVATDRAPAARRQRLEAAGAEVLVLPPVEGEVDLGALVDELGRRGLTSVLVEGGGTLAGAFFDAGLVDKVVAFLAPIVIGGRTARTAVEGKGVAAMAEVARLERVRVEQLGPDMLLSGYVRVPEAWCLAE